MHGFDNNQGYTRPLGRAAGAGRTAARLQFQRTQLGAARKPPTGAPNDGAGDPRLAGNWVYQNLSVSGDALMASEEYLAFRADGSYFYGKGRSVAGGGNWLGTAAAR